MNNNYYNFNPNPNFNRNIPVMPINPNNMGAFRNVAPVPRLSSLFSGARAGAATSAMGTSKVTFSSLLNGASKTLGVINQAIPVFYQVKPIWNNAKTMFRVAREISSSNSSSINSSSNSNNASNNTANTNTETNINSQEKESDNSPTFFI